MGIIKYRYIRSRWLLKPKDARSPSSESCQDVDAVSSPRTAEYTISMDQRPVVCSTRRLSQSNSLGLWRGVHLTRRSKLMTPIRNVQRRQPEFRRLSSVCLSTRLREERLKLVRIETS